MKDTDAIILIISIAIGIFVAAHTFNRLRSADRATEDYAKELKQEQQETFYTKQGEYYVETYQPTP